MAVKGESVIDNEENSEKFFAFLADKDLSKRSFEAVFRMQELFIEKAGLDR